MPQSNTRRQREATRQLIQHHVTRLRGNMPALMSGYNEASRTVKQEETELTVSRTLLYWGAMVALVLTAAFAAGAVGLAIANTVLGID